MGLERKAGDYKDLGQLTRSSRAAALDEGALPMMAAVARSLDTGATAPAPQALSAPVSPVTAALSVEPAPIHLVASVETVVEPRIHAAEPPIPIVPAPMSAQTRPAAGNTGLARVFERYAGKAERLPEVPPAPPSGGTPLKPLFDRLR